MSQTSASADRWVQIGVVALAAATALVHLSLFPDPVFILNGLGYLALAGALVLPIAQLAPRRALVRRILIGYTALTVVLWVILGARTPIAYLDKLVEIALIALLVWDDRRAARAI